MEFFDTTGGFLVYVGALGLSGILMLILAATGLGGGRVVNTIIGLAALGYAGFLILTVFIQGGSYRFFWYAFILPIFAIYQLFKGLKSRGEEQAAPQAPAA